MSEIIDRVTRMENILDDLAAVVEKSWRAMDDIENSVEKLDTIKEYYESQYMKDWAADERGELPKDLKRGVLSEDGVHIVLTDFFELSTKMTELAKKIR